MFSPKKALSSDVSELNRPKPGPVLEAQLRVDELLKEYSEERAPWPCSKGAGWHLKVITHNMFDRVWTNCLD